MGLSPTPSGRSNALRSPGCVPTATPQRVRGVDEPYLGVSVPHFPYYLVLAVGPFLARKSGPSIYPARSKSVASNISTQGVLWASRPALEISRNSASQRADVGFCSTTQAAICVREVNPSFARICSTCPWAVR